MCVYFFLFFFTKESETPQMFPEFHTIIHLLQISCSPPQQPTVMARATDQSVFLFPAFRIPSARLLRRLFWSWTTEQLHHLKWWSNPVCEFNITKVLLIQVCCFCSFDGFGFFFILDEKGGKKKKKKHKLLFSTSIVHTK